MLFSFRPPWRLLLASWVLLLSACMAQSTPDEPLVKSRAWRMDASGQATLADMQAATDWQDLPQWKGWGYGTETIWVRLELRGAEKKTHTHWVVRVRPPYLDYVTLYDPTADLVLHTGDAVSPQVDDLDSINFTLQIPTLTQDRTVYLQMHSTSTRVLDVTVLPYSQAQRLNRLQEWLMGFILALSAILGIWATVQWLITRERVIGAFAVKQAFATAWTFLVFGFARIVVGPWLPEGVLTEITSAVVPWTASATLWFISVFLQRYQPARWTLQACRALAVFMLFIPALQWFHLTMIALPLINFCAVLSCALIVTTMLTAMPKRVKQPIPQTVLLIYLLVYGTLNSGSPLVNFGLIEANPIVLFGNLAHIVLDGIVMFMMLQIRARHLQIEQQYIAMDLKSSRERFEAERHHRREQSQLFAMLAHEMKTPLATLRMWMDAGQLKPETMERAIADMNSVIERCVHTGQLADQGLQPVVQAIDPVELTRNCIAACRAPESVNWLAPGAIGPIHTDAQMLSIVLGNLLDNACKYSAPNSRIQLTLQSALQDGRPGWLWQVSNQVGPAGLPDASRLFEKYYRSAHARRLSGSGLGLFLVKGLLDLMQGSVRYEANNGHAVFSLWLPEQTASC